MADAKVRRLIVVDNEDKLQGSFPCLRISRMLCSEFHTDIQYC